MEQGREGRGYSRSRRKREDSVDQSSKAFYYSLKRNNTRVGNKVGKKGGGEHQDSATNSETVLNLP